jgi:inward rectifier potassium channel
MVVKRTSYLFDEVEYGAKFLPMFKRDISNKMTVLNLDLIDKFERIVF